MHNKEYSQTSALREQDLEECLDVKKKTGFLAHKMFHMNKNNLYK